MGSWAVLFPRLKSVVDLLVERVSAAACHWVAGVDPDRVLVVGEPPGVEAGDGSLTRSRTIL